MQARKINQRLVPVWMVPLAATVLVAMAVVVVFSRVFGVWKDSLSGPRGVQREAKSRLTFPIGKVDEPKPTPISSPTPAPTSQPLVGYCLRAPTVLYHHVEPMAQARNEHHAALTTDSGFFEQHVSYLVSSGYTTISVDQLARALVNHQKLPAKSIVITIDDGYQDVYYYAYPIAQKYRVVLNLMIPSRLIGNSGFLTWEQLREMVGSGLVFAYDHTWSHSSLGAAARPKVEEEIMTAKKQLEERLGKVVDIFAYPYGSRSNLVAEVLKSNGFIAALSTIPGFYQCDSFLYSLHRNRVGNLPLSQYGI